MENTLNLEKNKILDYNFFENAENKTIADYSNSDKNEMDYIPHQSQRVQILFTPQELADRLSKQKELLEEENKQKLFEICTITAVCTAFVIVAVTSYIVGAGLF